MNITQLTNFIAIKDTIKRLVTGPVAIPECPDCDFDRGEKTFSVDEIETMVHKYNTEYRNADSMHIINSTKDIIGQSVENWTLKEPMSVKNINGTIVSLPIGTWMTTIKIEDDTTWERIESGELRGFSAMYVPETRAELFKAEKRTLVAELEDPVPVSIAVVDKPCVFDAIFTSVKNKPVPWGTGDPSLVDDSDKESNKAGRSISNNTFSKIQSAFDSLNELIQSAMNERTPTLEDNTMSKEEQVSEKSEEKIEFVTKNDLDEKLESLKSELIEALKAEEEPEASEEDESKEEEDDDEPSELEALKTEIEDLKQQVNKSNDLTDEPPKKPEASNKRDENGLPINRAW